MMTDAKADSAALEGPSAPPLSRFERQRGKILDAATMLLNQRGIAGMTLQEVAEQLGLKTTAVTYYFRYKEQLVRAVFEDSLQRLKEMVEQAGKADTPRARVDQYLRIHFDHYAAAMQGKTRPLAILSEMRALEGAARAALMQQYQAVFRGVRAFFGPADTAARKLRLTARTQMLNEVVFWSAIWLKQYDVGDFDTVRRQLFDILDGGIATRPSRALPAALGTGEAVAAGDSYSQFLRTATRLMNEVGYRGTSIDRIAAELNLTKGSFYHHLPTKDELILQCFRNSYQRLRDLREQARKAGLDAWETLISVIAQAMKYQFGEDYPLLRTTAFQALPDSVRQIPYEHAQRTTLLFSGLLVDSVREGAAKNVNPLLASHIIMSTINSASDIRSWAAKQDRDDAVADCLSAITRGIFHPA
ncbi:TetR family transcriptional regulator [Sphingobium sp. TA15]|uniref:TetR-family transcriptional regulator n=2 Tax=Sphingomonadaceae TaxID=41297 RepID=D4Z828_SPHIU|nr:TetR-family transcriptional regulator [Sphingobium indicum UT26S]BDD68695.1 TetR family transcriptional regulator [Sphingobium sp. TA15]